LVSSWLDAGGSADLALEGPPFLSESFVAVAYTPMDQRTGKMYRAPAYSDTMLERIARADVLAIVTPM
jgi:FMN-dependent NADH-azoreductase